MNYLLLSYGFFAFDRIKIFYVNSLCSFIFFFFYFSDVIFLCHIIIVIDLEENSKHRHSLSQTAAERV